LLGGYVELRQFVSPAGAGGDMLYVRVGNLGFSLRIYTNAGNEADWARVREVMLKLGRLGASRLT
jgi:hypothetical protein